ncbi:MAG: transglycosylase SLT domain-containing protein [Methylocapsa sp.]|nr:transglycosylase SLT domain-containing protein [Methylocapsa sp.]
MAMILLTFALPLTSSYYDARAAAVGVKANICEREMSAAAKRYGVPLAILYAVGLTETGRRGSLQPFALNIEGPSFFAASSSEALRRFYEAKQHGARLIDVGCMQLDYFFHGRRFPSVETMLDPHENVDYAARFLSKLRSKEGSWTLAAARYHAGPKNDPAQKEYVCRVITNMIASGFGEWTPNARVFCGEAAR